MRPTADWRTLGEGEFSLSAACAAGRRPPLRFAGGSRAAESGWAGLGLGLGVELGYGLGLGLGVGLGLRLGLVLGLGLGLG